MIQLRKEEFRHLALFVEIRSLLNGSIIQCEHVGNEEHRSPEQPTARPRRRERDIVDSSMEHIEASVDNDTKRKQDLCCRQTDGRLVDAQHYVWYRVDTRLHIVWEFLLA